MEVLDVAFAPTTTVCVQIDDRVHEVVVTSDDDATTLVHSLLEACETDIAPGSTMAVDLERHLGQVILGMARSETAFYRSLRRAPGPSVTMSQTAGIALAKSKLRIDVLDGMQLAAVAAETKVAVDTHASDEESKCDEDDLGDEGDLSGREAHDSGSPEAEHGKFWHAEMSGLEGLGKPIFVPSSKSPAASLQRNIVESTETYLSPRARAALRSTSGGRTRATSKADENYEAYMAVLEAQSSPRRNNDRETFF